MKVTETDLPGVKLIEPCVFGDERYREHGIGPDFVQANCSHSGRGVLRGLHYQWPEPQGKLSPFQAGVYSRWPLISDLVEPARRLYA